MKILIADDSPVAARMLEILVESSGHESCLVRDGEQAWKIASAPNPPRIMFLDWVMPHIDGLELCRKIRKLQLPYYIYIVIISSRGKHGDIRLGYEAGADDFITKPFLKQEIFARIQAAERVVQALSSVSFPQALLEARNHRGGDIVVRSGSIVGRILVHRGKIAWAHISNEPGSLYAVLASDVEPILEKESIDEVLSECSISGRNFAEVIVDWGLLDAETLHHRIRSWIRARITAMGKLDSPMILYIPEKRSYGDGLLFDISEVVPPHLLFQTRSLLINLKADTDSVVPLNEFQQQKIRDNLNQAFAIEGALSVGILDNDSGEQIGSRGDVGDHETAWHTLKLVALTSSTDPVEDVIINTHHHVHILRTYSLAPLRFLFMTADRTRVRLGMLRLALADCTENLNE